MKEIFEFKLKKNQTKTKQNKQTTTTTTTTKKPNKQTNKQKQQKTTKPDLKKKLEEEGTVSNFRDIMKEEANKLADKTKEATCTVNRRSRN